jgi:hypothetical protein
MRLVRFRVDNDCSYVAVNPENVVSVTENKKGDVRIYLRNNFLQWTWVVGTFDEICAALESTHEE